MANAKTHATMDFSRRKLQRLMKMLDSDIAAHHNWIASAIEHGKSEYAAWLVKELRDHQELAADIRGAYKEHFGMYPDEDKANKPKWFTEETGKNTDGTPADPNKVG